MKKFLSIALLLLSFAAIAQSEKDIPARPQPQKLVNVLVKERFMTPEQIDALERKLVAYDDSTSNQIAVVVVDDLKGKMSEEKKGF